MVTKKMFFDRKVVVRGVDRATRRVLGRFGAFVRRAAKSSIRKRKRTSAPGQPPSSHAGLLKKLIFFGYDAGKQSVVIGPQRLNQKVGDAPAALEHGGSVFVPAGLRRDKMGLSRRSRRRRRMNIKARPYMGPAFDQEKPKLPQMWANSVK